MKSKYNIYEICNGHDFINALYEILTKLGSKNMSKIKDADQLHLTFLSNYHKGYFKKSALGTKLSEIKLLSD